MARKSSAPPPHVASAAARRRLAGFGGSSKQEGGPRAVEPAVPAVKRRPKDRKNQILEQAVRLFTDRGFHSVKLEDIAEAAGVTARALYRHYDNKQALLAAAIRTGQEQYQSARLLSQGEAASTPRPLSVELPDLIAAAVASRSLDRVVAARGPLPRRRRAHGGAQAHQRDRRGHARGCPTGDAGLQPCAHGAASLGGVQHPHQPWQAQPDPAGRRTQRAPVPGVYGRSADPAPSCLGAARCDTDTKKMFCSRATRPCWPPAHTCSARRATRPSARPRSERERGLRVPVCTGRSRPNRRSSMHSSAASTSGGASRRIRALRADAGPAECLRELVEGRVRVSLDDPDLVSVSVTELSHASSEVRDGYTRNENDREGVWIDVVRKLVPQTTLPEARLLVAAAISFIDDAVRTWHLTRYAGVADEMTAIALSILTSRHSPQRCNRFRRRRSERFR